ncbi:MFS transporter [Pacificibacter sp. AS14]|uniref:MFS transporter n=1 Tax=Pacificibacter sp. AS14 TaxID=3135785 RepID=UPI0031719B8E
MPRRAYYALYLLFFIQPLSWGGWLVRISEIQRDLALNPLSLSIAIAAVPVGLLLSLMFISRVYAKLGVRKTTALSLLVFLLFIPLPGFSANLPVLCCTLFLVGIGLAAAELGLNLVADTIEKRGGRPIMGRAHGFWSLGLLAGSVASSGLSFVGLSVGLTLVLLAVLTGALAIWVFKVLPDVDVPKVEKPINNNHKERLFLGWTTVAISFFVFGIAMGEGAMADWASVYMSQVYDVSGGIEGLGFVCYATSITLGRFGSDFVRGFLSGRQICMLGCGFAIIGVACLVAAPAAFVSYFGFICIGLGLAAGFPLAVTAVASQPVSSVERHLAFLSQIALSGQLLGPLLIGLTAQFTGMRLGFAVLIPIFLASAYLSKWILAPRVPR